MALPKLYEQITWVNDTTPALNEDNLNAMSQALNDVDDRVIDLAGTIMEDVPQIQEDLEILEPAIESIDSNVERAETAAESAEDSAESAEEWANIANPPIVVTKDFASIISIDDAIPKAARDVKLKVTPKQDLHGYTKPWVGGAGKNQVPFFTSTTVSGRTWTVSDDGIVTVTGESTGNSYLTKSITLPAGTYQLSGGDPNGVSGTGDEYVQVDGAVVARSYGNTNMQFTLNTEKTVTLALRDFQTAGQSGTHVFKPMICLASAQNPLIYEPYTNICPITGWTGANVTNSGHNLFDGEWESGALDINTGATTSGDAWSRSKNYINVMGGTEYHIYMDGSDSSHYWYMLEYDANKTYLGYRGSESIPSRKWTTRSNTAYIKLQYKRTIATVVDYNVFVNYPSSLNDYTPFTGNNRYVISFGGTYYGGTLDVTSGVLTLDRGIYDLGDLSYTAATVADGTLFYTGLNPISNLKNTASWDDTANALCSNMISGKIRDVNEGRVEGLSIGPDSSRIRIFSKSAYKGMTAAAFKTAMSGVQLVYELATPTTVQLTPTEVMLLQGANVLSGDTGNIYLEYDASMIERIANAKLDIDTFKSVVAASSDFANFKTRVAAL